MTEEVFWNPLQRSEIPLSSSVPLDEITKALIEPFDYKSEGSEFFFPYLLPEELPQDFNIGVIVGASGTGKSTLLKALGHNPNDFPVWGYDSSIASHFSSPTEASEKFAAAGLMSVPDWVKPYRVLSTGQRFRADLARSLKNGAIIDEFTSVIDRNVAKAASTAMARYVRKNNIKRIVLATVHRDILEFLEPDWVIDTDRGEWSNGRWLRRPQLEIEVFPCDHTLWRYFAAHHYLDGNLNKASHNYMAVWENRLVGFVSAMTYPSGTVQNAYREHRLVIHPDFQGFGIGPRLSELIAQHYIDNGKRYFSKTSHPRLGSYRDASSLWKPTSKNHMRRKDGILSETKQLRWGINPDRWSFSHEYIG
jgi:GNAT superfamily N-acetyltransferase